MVLVLAGCTGGGPSVGSSGPPESSDRPVVTESVAPVPSVTPTVSEEERLLAMIPEEAKGDDLLAAVAMAKFFILLHPGLFKGDDPDLFAFLCLPQSTFCATSLASASEGAARGESQHGGDFTVTGYNERSVLDTWTDETITALVGFTVSQSEYEVVDEAGAVVRDGGPSEFDIAVALRLDEGVWKVYALEFSAL